LPKDGLFYPAIQNKTKIIAPHSLRVDFKFELVIPADKATIPNLTFTSDEEDEGQGGHEINNNLSMLGSENANETPICDTQNFDTHGTFCDIPNDSSTANFIEDEDRNKLLEPTNL
jgi:hypothetical protein